MGAVVDYLAGHGGDGHQWPTTAIQTNAARHRAAHTHDDPNRPVPQGVMQDTLTRPNGQVNPLLSGQDGLLQPATAREHGRDAARPASRACTYTVERLLPVRERTTRPVGLCSRNL